MTQAFSPRPLVVDLDGTLVRTDLLYESFFGSIGPGKALPIRLFREFAKGRAALKHFLANESILDYETLPYDQNVLDLIGKAKAAGHPVYLATASHESHARAISEHLGIFDGVFASDAVTNLKGAAKARKLVEVFGEKGFDYVGNSYDDLAVWAHADTSYTIRTPASVKSKLASVSSDIVHVDSPAVSLRTWFKAMRVHQYTKNLLLFVPMFTAHRIDLWTFSLAVLGVLAFSLCASSVYLLNDLVDLKADRAHLSKRNRPFANGDLPIEVAGILVPCLLIASCLVALLVSWQFLACLLGYFILTTAYTFWLKSKMIVDVVVLAMLYTARILAGGVATGVMVSEWLLAFSIFIFTSLALMKRYVELTALVEKNLPDPKNRNYKTGDLPIVSALAAASAMNSVTIFALYLSQSAMIKSYSRPWALWAICPILLYWLARALMMAHRRTMDDDPVVFAIRDRVSRIAIVCMVVVVLIAI